MKTSSPAIPIPAARACGNPVDNGTTASRILEAGLDLRLLHVLVALDECRDLQHAAALLHATPVATAVKLRRLERRLDVRLFERKAGAVAPTQYPGHETRLAG